MSTTKRYGQLLIAIVFSFSLMLAAMGPVFAADLNGKTVTKITVTGNSTVSEPAIMAVVKTKPGEALTPDKIKQDLQAVYELGNFFDVVANFTEVPEGVEVTYTVMENPVLKDIVIKGNNKVTVDKLMTLITVPKGQILNSKMLDQNARNIEKYYHDQGYILAKVSDVAMSSGGVLTISISEGVLEGFAVTGNEKTKDYVITREMKLKPGDPFNVKDARRSMQRVYNLGYFEDVNMKLNPGKDPNAVVLETSVVEQKTGTFTVGAGYSESDGLVGIIEVGDKNFRGTGDNVKVHWEFGGSASDRNYELTYTRPWLDSKQTSVSFNIYNMTNEYTDYYDDGDQKSTYDKNRKGFEITLGRPSGEYVKNYITLKNRKDSHMKNVEGPEDYSQNQDYLEDNFGLTRSVTLMRVYDSRDNIFSPTEGSRYSLTTEFAGGSLGGDFTFNKYTAEGRMYKKTVSDHVLAFRVMAGYADGNMPDSGRFAVGGADTLRGYDDDQFKGDKMLIATAEYRFPIANRVQGVVFTDTGKAWDGEGYKLDDMEASVGVGLRVSTPIGPIKLDWAQGSQGGKAHFSFGGQF